MNALEAALADLAGFMEEARIPYMVSGGFANLKWGRPRLTQDLDLTVRVADEALPAFVERLGKRYRLQAPDPVDFARDTGVIPVATAAGIRIDISLASMSYEETAIRRAVPIAISGATVRICTAEDLVLHKLASDRPRDLEDVEEIVLRQGATLDRSYLDPLVDQLVKAIERPDVRIHYRACLKKAGLAAP